MKLFEMFLIMCLCTIKNATGLNCYVTDSAAYEKQNFASPPLIKNCTKFLSEISKTGDFQNENDVRCFTVGVETEDVNIVIQGCTQGSCSQTMTQVQWHFLLETVDVRKMMCRECREDLCNYEATRSVDEYKDYAIIAIVAVLVLTIAVASVLRQFLKSGKSYSRLWE